MSVTLLKEIWFIDIETVPIRSIPDMLFIKRFKNDILESIQENTVGEIVDHRNKVWEEKASLYAEFGKIICISVGKISGDKLRIKTIAGKDEVKILKEFSELLTTPGMEAKILCAHNGKEFDFPFLFRRYIINNLPVPEVLQVAGKKSWDIPHLDTMELWGHMQWKYRCSLELLANILGIESPKQDMDGNMVSDIYYSKCPADILPFDHDEAVVKRIGDYCAGDIVTMVKIFCRMKDVVAPIEIQYV